MNSDNPAPLQGAANNLVGQTIPDGWTVSRQLPRPGTPGAEDLTGSWFSIGYIASNGHKEAFLKVIDVARALKADPGSTLMDRLKLMTDSHSFECSILDICTSAKLDRVVQIIGKGEIQLPPGSGNSIPIPYILFELADADVRKIVSRASKLEDAWRLRVLHDVTVGLQQLHGQQIAHQDLKPSNILLFELDGKRAKIGDLGRASRKGMDSNHDRLKIAGAANYAPPEQVYGTVPERWEDRREGCDLYHLGSLVTYMFSGITPTQYYVQTLADAVRPVAWNGQGACDYQSALPMLTASFTAFVEQVQSDLPEWCRDELSRIIVYACNPNYAVRGDPDSRSQTGSPIGIQTFVSRFDRLAKRAMVELRR